MVLPYDLGPDGRRTATAEKRVCLPLLDLCVLYVAAKDAVRASATEKPTDTREALHRTARRIERAFR